MRDAVVFVAAWFAYVCAVLTLCPFGHPEDRQIEITRYGFAAVGGVAFATLIVALS